MRFFYIFISFFMWLIVIATTPFMFAIVASVWLLSFWWDRRLFLMNIFNSIWGSMYIWLNPIWRLKPKNLKKYKRNRQYIIVANHQSMLDILVMYTIFPIARWVSKTENFKLPFIGWAMRLAKAIEIKRGDRASVIRFMSTAKKELEKGNTLLIFAEGTRTKNDNVMPLRSGAFELALKNKVDILPVVHRGSGKALPKHGFLLKNSQQIHLEILSPIPYDEFKELSIDQLKEVVHKLMQEKYLELKERMEN